MIEGDTIKAIGVNSTWEAELGPGCELSVALASGRELFVIRSALENVDEEIEMWRTERVGTSVADTKEIATWPLADGGQQTTLEIEMEDGFAFEGDLIEAPGREEHEEDDIETEWTFEGQPGLEMGKQQGGPGGPGPQDG